jgi:hypothetical protein
MPYNKHQEMFLLGFAANFGTQCSGAERSDINQCVLDSINGELQTSRLQNADGSFADVNLAQDWIIVWLGVAVVPRGRLDADYGPYPTNVMFVARKDEPPNSTYFIGIAGTNHKSFYDALEDFRVHEMVPWAHAKGPTESTRLISLGFHKGLELLTKLKSVEGVPGAGMSLEDYLRGVMRETGKGQISIITGGHSQGGSLSPLVALWLRDTHLRWDPLGKLGENIFSWPFAGPSPGNEAFAVYYDRRMPNTTSVINSSDVATKLFNEDDLQQIPTIYEPLIHAGQRITNLKDFLLADVQGKGYTRIPYRPSDPPDPPTVISLTAAVNATLYNPDDKDCLNFTMQMGYQHLQAYFELLGLSFVPESGTKIPIDQFQGLCAWARS